MNANQLERELVIDFSTPQFDFGTDFHLQQNNQIGRTGYWIMAGACLFLRPN